MALTLESVVETEIDRLAAATGRSKPDLIDTALRRFIATESAFLVAVEEGKQALREGRVTDHADVVSAFNELVGTSP